MNAALTWLELIVSCGIVAMALCIAEIVREHPAPQTAAPPAIRLTAADFLAAAVHEDTATIVMPKQWWEAWAERDPVQAYGWKAREQAREWLAVTAASSARESARRIGEAVRARQAVAAQADLIAAIRAAYAAVTLEGEWPELVAAITAVMGSAA